MRRIGLVRIDLQLTTPGGVTAPELDAITDLPLRKHRHEQVWTPPSSVAGSLRAHFGDRAEQFFGSRAPATRGSDDQLQPSPVRFLGTRTTLPPGTDLQVRASTAVDPVRGAAVPATLRSRELLPAGTTITLYLRYDDRAHLPGVPAYDIEAFARLAATWRPQLGRGRSTGHGMAQVRRVAYRTLHLGVVADLRFWLTAGRDELFPDTGWPHDHTPTETTPTWLLELQFEGVDALHIGSGSRDDLARVLRVGDTAVIPASSWKGLLRSRCGFILRSCGQPACLVPSIEDDAPVRACQQCRLCALFGWTGEGGTNDEPIGRIGDLRFHDSTVDSTTGRRNHVAIDRFTGGARRHLLYADEVLTDTRFTLRISAVRPGFELSPADRGLILLAIRDLHDGLIGLGKSTTRGYGTVRLAPTNIAHLDELRPDHQTGAEVRRLLRGAA